jgi:signal transduction histidine kinase
MTPDRVFDRVSDAAAIRLGRAVGVISMASAVVSVIIFLAIGELETWYDEWGVHNAAGGFLFGLILFVAVSRRPRNGAVWAVGWSGLFQSVFQALAAAMAVLLVVERYGNAAVADYRNISDLPAGISFFTWLGLWSWVPAIGLMLVFGFLLFPDGRLPGPSWRIVAWLAAISIAGATIGLMTLDASADELPPLAQVFMPFVGLSILAAVASLFFRYRSADGDQRHQLRWMLLAATIFGGSFVVTTTLDAAGVTNGFDLAFSLATLPLLVGAYGVAILKYRLYDIDVVISKSVTYVGLAAAITALYATVVVGPLLIIGETDDGGQNLWLPIVATAVVAVLFEPIRSRMQRWANRLVYGQRSSPHEVLSQVTARLSESGSGSDTVDLARLVAEGTGAEQAVVWLRNDDGLVPDGVWSASGSALPESTLSAEVIDDESSAVTDVRHGGELLGAVSITKPRSDPVTPADRQLVADVAAGAGLLLRNMRLNRQLEARAREVRESRHRLIAAQDAERHRLERDLHDGAQQQVVALKVKLGIAEKLADRAGVEDVASLVSGLADETQQAVDALRAVAHGIYPPLLEAEGLEVALRAVARTSSVDMNVATSGLKRYGRQVEETVYFCVLEAIDRVHMSGAAATRIGLRDGAGELEVVIDHDGRVTREDLAAVSDRVDAFGGTIDFEVLSDAIQRITTRVPADENEMEPA